MVKRRRRESPTTEAELTVAKVPSTDVGGKVARIGPEVRRRLGLKIGDVVEIVGERKTFARLWPGVPWDAGRGLIRVDRYTRENAQTEIGALVRIGKAKAERADTVELSPVRPFRIKGADDILKAQLVGKALGRGDLIPLSVGVKTVPLKVTGLTPNVDCVIVSERTRVTLRDKPVSR
jgi:transitional endoplasmic reticulum ATPase